MRFWFFFIYNLILIILLFLWYFRVTTGKVPTILHLNNSKVKKPVMSKTKLNINSSLRVRQKINF